MIDAHNTCVKVLKPAYSKGELVKLLVDTKTTALEMIKKKSQKPVVPLQDKSISCHLPFPVTIDKQ